MNPPFSIPELADGHLAQLAAQIKPLCRDETGNARHIEPVGLRTIAYTWDPKFIGEPVTQLPVLGEIRCLHRYGYYGLFKPSIAEVLCQIPQDLLDRAGHFEIIKSPQWDNDLNAEKEALNAGYHVSTVRIYQKTEPHSPAEHSPA